MKALSGRMVRSMALGLVLALVAACGTDDAEPAGSGEQSEDEPLAVGVTQPLSGALATLGNQALDGIELAIDLVNEEGGVNGRPVELVVADASSVEEARSQAERLVREDGVPIVLGTYGSSLAISAATATTRFGAFYFEVSSASADITRESLPYSVKTPWTVGDLIDAMVDELTGFFPDELDVEAPEMRVGMIYEDTEYGTAVSTLLAEELDSDDTPQLVVSEPYTAETINDFGPIISRLRDADLDLVLATSYLDDAQLFLRQAAEQGLDVPAIAGLTAGFADTGLPEGVPDEVLEGIYVYDSNPQLTEGLTEDGLRLTEELLDRFEERHGNRQPPSHTGYAYLGTYAAMRHIVDGVDETDPDAILEAAMDLDLDYGSLPMGFGIEFGDAEDETYPHVNLRTVISLNQWQNEELVTVSPSEFREAEPVPWSP